MTRSTFASRTFWLASVLVAAVMLAGAVQMFSPTGSPAGAAEPATGAATELERAFVQVAEQVEPAVVSISAERTTSGGSGGEIPEMFRDFFPDLRPRGPQSRTVGGSGVIVRTQGSTGYILTNDHVVGGTDNVRVTLQDGREFSGTVLRDVMTDLAVVKIEATNLPKLSLGNSGDVKPGQWAIAIGSPFGLSNTLTVGVVSALERENYIPDPDVPQGGRYYASLIQTDAAINPGNSGGPLVNLKGEIIGINVAIESPSGANAGIGFAIPSNTAEYVLDQLITRGKVVRGYLGLTPADLTPARADRYGVEKGALVVQVQDDTPASRAGIQVEDVIVELAGKPITTGLELRDVAARTAPGTKTKAIVVRDKQRRTLNITIGEREDETAAATPETPSQLGLTVRTLTAELRESNDIDSSVRGVLVTEVERGSAASRGGIRVGDVVMRVNGQAVTTSAQFNQAIARIDSGEIASLVVRTETGTRIADIRIP